MTPESRLIINYYWLGLYLIPKNIQQYVLSVLSSIANFTSFCQIPYFNNQYKFSLYFIINWRLHFKNLDLLFVLCLKGEKKCTKSFSLTFLFLSKSLFCNASCSFNEILHISVKKLKIDIVAGCILDSFLNNL